jgi:regulator of cell morphogenesis and NO signaling
MTVTDQTTVRDIAVSNPSTVRVFEKLGIDYCCGGNKSLKDICESKHIDLQFLLERLGAAGEALDDPDLMGWHKEPLAMLIQHIVRKHHNFVRDEMPRLRVLAEKVVARHGAQDSSLVEVRDCIAKINEEMTSHMLKEEQVLFPYMAKMEHELGAGKELPLAFFGSVRNPIASMLAEHDAAGELLKRIRSLTRDYTLPEGACPTFRALFSTMQEFETDMHRHVHLENNILFPRALAMEQQATKQSSV